MPGAVPSELERSSRRRRVHVRSIVQELAITASLAAFYVVFRVIPTFPMFGVANATFGFGDMIAPLYGLLLGPFLAPVAVGVGTVIAFFAGKPPIFLGLDFLPASVSAAIVGLISRRRLKEAFLLNLALIGAFVALPFRPGWVRVGASSIPYVWLYIVGLALLVSPLSRWASNVISQDWKRRTIRQVLAVLNLAFVGTLAQHVTGGILTQLVFGLYSQRVPRGFLSWDTYWTFLFWLYPFERAVIAIIATLVAVPTLFVLKSSGLLQRLQRTT